MHVHASRRGPHVLLPWTRDPLRRERTSTALRGRAEVKAVDATGMLLSVLVSYVHAFYFRKFSRFSTLIIERGERGASRGGVGQTV